MITLFSDWSFTLFTLSALVALSVGIFRWFRLSFSLRMLWFYIGGLPLWYLTFQLLLGGKANEPLVLNVLRISQIILVGVAYLWVIPAGTFKKILWITGIFVLVFSITNFFFIQGPSQGNTLTQYVFVGWVVILGLSFIHNFTQYPEGQYFLLQPMFLITMAIVAQVISELVYLWFLQAASQQGMQELGSMGRVYRVMLIVFYLICGLGFWRQDQKELSSSWSIS